jgi:hypothetical protein
MDDGVKLKPWGAPPITGTFAIAFETKVNVPAIQFELAVEEVANNTTVAPPFKRHHLVYGGTTLVSVVPDGSSPVKVSFEHVGLVAPDVVRGFVVLETTVGSCTQVRHGTFPFGHESVDIAEGADVNLVPELLEATVFNKEAGRLQMWVSTVPYRMTV